MRFAPVLLLMGCTHLIWNKRGATHQDFLSDRYECKTENRTLVRYDRNRANSSRYEVDGEQFSDCMQARGWRLIERE